LLVVKEQIPIACPTIPDHDLLKKIGAGSYGEVWLARSAVGTLRAVKIVWRKTFWHDHPFEREFKGIQKFEPISRSHNGLVDILQIGRGEGYFYYVMELADDANGMKKEECRMQNDQTARSGTAVSSFSLHPSALPQYTPRTLTSELQCRARLPVSECVQIGLSLTSALGHLHQNGLVHRDVKPANIIFVRGVPKLADIGLVAEVAEARSYVGTEGFIPPEGPGSPQADLYSLGKLLYEISTGEDRHAFPELPPDLAELSEAHQLVELNAVVVKACQNDVRERYQSAEEMHAELLLLKTGQSVKGQRAMRQRRAAGKKASSAFVLFASVAAAALFVLRGRSDSKLHSANQEVVNLVERGNYCAQKHTPERLNRALAYFKRALELDAKFAPAYIGLYKVRMAQHSGVGNPSVDAGVNLRAAAAKLMEIDPSLAEARIASANVKYLDGQFREALAEARLATRMRAASKEGNAFVHEIYGWYLMNAGDPEAALQEFLFAERNSPANANIQRHLGRPYFFQRKFDLALDHFQKSIELEPLQFDGYFCIGSVYEEKGEFLNAIQAFEQGDLLTGKNEESTKLFYDGLRNASKQGGSEGYWSKRLETALSTPAPDAHYVAIILAHLGKTVEAYDWLEKACNQGELEGLWFDVCWDRNNERFKKIATQVGLKP
jgi:tetratricopeptide (TPR) repeat protein